MFFQPNLSVISKLNEANPINFLIPEHIKEERNPYHWHMIYFLWNAFVSFLYGVMFLLAKRVWISGEKRTATAMIIYAVVMSLFKTGFCISLMTEWGYDYFTLFIIYFTGIMPHGIFEIPAISLVLTFVVINFKKLDNEGVEFVLKNEIINLVRNPLFQASIILLAIAAPIEAYVTPYCLDLFLNLY